MGLFDFFKSDAKQSRAVARWSKKLMEKYQQTAERKRAIEALTSIGTEEAVVALLQRYTYRTEQTIVDEDEKRMVYECVVSLGDKAVDGLKAYIEAQSALYWPVKALSEIVGQDEGAAIVLTALEGVPDSFGGNALRRPQLVDNLRGFAEVERVHKTLIVLLQDEDEEVVLRAIDALAAREDDPDVPLQIVPVMMREETSIRLRTLILELIIEKGWNVKRFKKALGDVLPESYFIDGVGVIRRR